MKKPVRPDAFSRRKFVIRSASLLLSELFCSACAYPEALSMEPLRRSLHDLTHAFDGRVGIGVEDSGGRISINGNQKFSLQSVMKLLVAAATMDAIDHRGWRLEDAVLVRKQDLSLNIQPLATLVGDKGHSTTLGDLLRRAVVDSDSAATDILFARVGGADAINRFLKRAGIEGVHVDRDERHLQTETAGLQWRPEYVDAKKLEQAKKHVSREHQAAAFQAYLKDVRDTATPAGMTTFLYRLASGKILSRVSTDHLMSVMRQTVTFPDRLKAGVPAGWTLAHKTGTSATWEGVTGTTNDVGILTAPDKHIIAVSAFVAQSRRSSHDCAALIAEAARIITAAYSKT